MRGAFLLSDLVGVLELLAIVIFALSGFVAAVAAISFRANPSGTTSDDALSKALESRNEFRRLLRFLFSFGAGLVFLSIVARSVETRASPVSFAVSLFLAFLAFALLAYVCVRTYRFVWQVTVIRASLTVSAKVHVGAPVAAESEKEAQETQCEVPEQQNDADDVP